MPPTFRHVLLGTIDLPGHRPEFVVLDTAELRLLRLIAARVGEVVQLGYVVLEHEHAPEEADPARPELREVGEVRPTDRSPRRRHLVGWLERLCASERLPPLGIPGPSVPYARFDAATPSLAVLGLREARVEHGRTGELVLAFAWGPLTQTLPLTKDLEARLAHAAPIRGRTGWQQALGRAPRFALVAFTPPEGGYCRKVVVNVV